MNKLFIKRSICWGFQTPLRLCDVFIMCWLGLHIDGLVQETPLITHWSYIFFVLTHQYWRPCATASPFTHVNCSPLLWCGSFVWRLCLWTGCHQPLVIGSKIAELDIGLHWENQSCIYLRHQMEVYCIRRTYYFYTRTMFAAICYGIWYFYNKPDML